MKADPTKDIWLASPYQRGGGIFLGRITPNGARSFFFRHMRDGKQIRFPIGQYDPKGKAGLTLAKAAQRADELSALYQSGVTDFPDYFAKKAEQKAAEETAARTKRESRRTLRKAVMEWVEVALTPRISNGHRQGRKDGGKQALNQFEKWLFSSPTAFGTTAEFIPPLSDLPVADITRSQFMQCIDAAKSANSLRVADMLLTDLRQFLNFAADREWVTANVLATVKRAKPVERDRFLSDEELELLWERTRPFDTPQAYSRKTELGLGANAPLPPNHAHLSQHYVEAIWITLATGCRVGELLSAKWADVDLGRRSWHLPQTKNQRPHDVSLSDFAIERFQALHQYSGGKKWVFPSKDGLAHIGEKTLGKALRDRMILVNPLKGRSRATGSLRLRNQKYDGVWTIHDARRTFAVIAGDLGFDPDLIDQAQNHVLQNRIRRTYQRSERTQALNKLFDSVGTHLAQRRKTAAPQTIVQVSSHISNESTTAGTNTSVLTNIPPRKRGRPKKPETLEREETEAWLRAASETFKDIAKDELAEQAEMIEEWEAQTKKIIAPYKFDQIVPEFHAMDMFLLDEENEHDPDRKRLILEREAKLRSKVATRQAAAKKEKAAQTESRALPILKNHASLIARHLKDPRKVTTEYVARTIREKWVDENHSGPCPSQPTVRRWVERYKNIV